MMYILLFIQPATPVAATNNLSDDLSSLSMSNNMPTENPPPVPNNTMSKEQILSAFNTPGLFNLFVLNNTMSKEQILSAFNTPGLY